ncbi:MAG: hypothetical protein HQM16_06770 [Deltaproteobacteria bacterium]|nr:hypothetical protein [Deltaproteobacteria bacterium]
MKLSFTSQQIDKVAAELVVFMHYEDDVPFNELLGLLDWRINGRLSALVMQNRFAGHARELLLMPSESRFKAEQIIILGLGKRAEFSEEHIGQVLDYFLSTVENMKVKQVCFSLKELLPSQFEWRNAVRILLSKFHDCKCITEVILREPEELVHDAKRRQINFGSQIEVRYI